MVFGNQNKKRSNEIATVGGSSTYVASDKNGNMTKMPKPDVWNAAFTCVYDAWNRMVQMKDGTTTVASYGYNGLNHRVKKIVGSETRLFYFNRNWQCLEERVGTTTDTQYVWGLRYIDDLVCRDKDSVRLYSIADPNWNVAALADTSGVIKERYVYSSFGKATVLNASFASQSPTAYSWSRLFTSQVLDAETGLMLYRNRVYHNGLGRFVTRDPMNYGEGDANLQRYALNRPLFLVDPSGNKSEKLTIDTIITYYPIFRKSVNVPPQPTIIFLEIRSCLSNRSFRMLCEICRTRSLGSTTDCVLGNSCSISSPRSSPSICSFPLPPTSTDSPVGDLTSWKKPCLRFDTINIVTLANVFSANVCSPFGPGIPAIPMARTNSCRSLR